MTAKLTAPSSAKHRAPLPPGIANQTGAQAAHQDAPVFSLSFDVQPVLSVVLRHVQLSQEAREAITRELIEVMNGAIIQPLATEHALQERPAEPARQDDPQLTTEQAAQLAGVSRPYMVKLIDTGAVQLHQRVGNQRRVLRSSVVRWQQAERVRQAQVLTQLAADLDEEILSP